MILPIKSFPAFCVSFSSLALLLMPGNCSADAVQPVSNGTVFLATNRVDIPASTTIIKTNITSIPAASPIIIATNASFQTAIVRKRKTGWEKTTWLPELRYDWTDVLISEDPSILADIKQTTSYANIKGATFAYTRNGTPSSDTWSANGALIEPIIYTPPLPKNGFGFAEVALAPSIAINKLSNSAQSSNDVDHLDYRLGGYAKLLLSDSDKFEVAIQGRAAFVYGTDTGNHASLPAGELEIEPQLIWVTKNAGAWFPNWISLGCQNILYTKGDKDVIDYKLRSWLHLEAGDLQQNGVLWNTVNGSFLRVGPTVQGQLNFNYLNGMSVSGEYGYQADINGPTGKNSLYTITGAFNVLDPNAGHLKVALTASYTKGALLLSKQPVDTFTLG